ncbi:MAG: hypothetical protein RLZ33_2604 [Bacteroidota bacterium]
MNKPLLILFIFIGSIAFGQNLVPNPSFEEFDYCPTGTNDPQAVATWFNPTMASPDYYNACASNGGGVPVNDWGYQEAQEGNGYLGIATYGQTINASNYREYLEVELLEQLVAGKTYYWCMYVSLLDSVDYASNNIGITLTNNQISDLGSEEMLISQIYWNSTEIIIDNINWTKLSGSFVANGGENFLTIGNFYSQLNTSYQQIDTNSIGGEFAYYYIDNVYLGAEICADVIIEMPNIFTPNSDGLNEIFTFKEAQGIYDYSISVYNRWGNRVYFGENTFNWDGKYNGESVTEGVYFYRIEYNKNESKGGFVQVVR